MKKIYSNPRIDVVKIETHKMLAESTTAVIGSGTKSGGEACGRDGWFDEDEE